MRTDYNGKTSETNPTLPGQLVVAGYEERVPWDAPDIELRAETSVTKPFGGHIIRRLELRTLTAIVLELEATADDYLYPFARLGVMYST